MFNELMLRLALRNLMRNKRRTGLMVLLVASGLTAMILTDGMVRGMMGLMVQKVTDTWMGEAQVHHPGFRDALDGEFYIKEPKKTLAILEADPDVTAFTARTMSGGMIASSNNVSPGVIFGIDPINEGRVSRLKEALVEGAYLRADKDNEILIGYKMAELLEVQLGDRIVTTLSEAESGELSQSLFRVTGLLKFNDRMMDKQMAYVSLGAGQKMTAIGEGVHEIAIRINPDADEMQVMTRLKKGLDPLGLETLYWHDLLPDLAGILAMTGFSSFIIGGILFILVSLGLINSMFMSIYERHYEFGVMLGVGTRRRQLFSLICWEGILLGTIGTVFGVIIGGLLNSWLSTHGLSFGENMEMSGVMINEPIKTAVDISQFTTFPLFVIALAAVACIIPALHGARLIPAVALRRAL